METWAKESNFGQAECLRVIDSYCEGAGSQNPNVNGNRVWNPGVLVVEEDKSYSSVIAEKLWIAEYRRISVLDLFSGFYAFHFIGIYIGAGKVIHFTCRGGLEIGTGTYLDKIIQISVPRHGGDNPCPNCGDQSTLNSVISSCLDCFLAGGNLYLFQYDVSKAILRGGTCTTAPSDPPEEIVHRARYLLSGNGFGEYHLLDNNCEDFAIYCKTGLLVFSVTKSGSSSQVNSVCAAGGVASLALRFLGVGRTAGQAASLAVCPASVVSAAASAISTTLGFVTTGFSAMVVAGYSKYCIGRVAYDVGVRKDIRKVPVDELSTLMAVLEGNILDNDNNDKNVVKLRI
ncbi:LOW QUALITY PROTEIN: hypothetical protein YC2023_118197 [Brassica napus]